MAPQDIGKLNALIREHADSAIEALARLPDPCVYDQQMQTPLDAAIESDNGPAFDLLMESKVAINFVPELDKELRDRIRKLTYDHATDTVEYMEDFAKGVAGDETVHWMRTPLLQACRYANRQAIDKLIQAGAKLNTTDLLRYSALELCHLTGSAELAHYFLDECREHGKQPMVSADFLERVVKDPPLYEKAVRDGKLNAQAKKLVFNLACALLDIDLVNGMLRDGHDVNKSNVGARDPLGEAATSYLAWAIGHPDSARVAPGHHRLMDGNQPLIYSGADLNALVTDLDKMDKDQLADFFFGEEGSEEQASDAPVVEITAPGGVNPKMQSDDQIEARLSLIDLLIGSGFDVSRSKDPQREDLLSDVVGLNEPRLLQKLVEVGVVFTGDGSPVQWAIQLRCFDMVRPLLALGFPFPEVVEHWATALEEYRAWSQD